jgi:hypothetical protein
MKNEIKLKVTLKGAVKVALSFFVIGTLLFAMQFLLGNAGSLIFLGLAFIAIAVLVNSIIYSKRPPRIVLCHLHPAREYSRRPWICLPPARTHIIIILFI